LGFAFRFADAGEQLERFHGLRGADHAGERREHAHRGALRLFHLRVLREEARVAGGVLFSKVEDHELSVEADCRTGDERLRMLHAGAVDCVARGEIVGAVEDHISLRDQLRARQIDPFCTEHD
jgi:hypothetical protein